jgi:hypothetical protein
VKGVTHKTHRIIALGLSAGIPIAGVIATTQIAGRVATAALMDNAAPNRPVTEHDVSEGILVGYILLGAVVAIIGTFMRALVHGWKGPKPEAVDFSGKCVAIAGQTLTVLSAAVRFVPDVAAYTPAIMFAIAGAVIVLAAVGLWFYGLKIDAMTPKPATPRSAPQPQQVTTTRPRPLASRDLGVMGLTTVAVAAVVGYVASRRS